MMTGRVASTGTDAAIAASRAGRLRASATMIGDVVLAGRGGAAPDGGGCHRPAAGRLPSPAGPPRVMRSAFLQGVRYILPEGPS